MNIRHLVAGLFAGLLSVDAVALQLGQVTATSRLGEPLQARVELYGTLPADARALRFEVSADIGLPRGSTARSAVEAIEPRLVLGDGGFAHVALRSAVPVTEPALSFRLRMHDGRTASIRHYDLALERPAPRIRSVAAVPPAPGTKVSRAAVSAGDVATVGPVPPGATLWRILDQAGLTSGDTRATIAQVVATNPHAFVNGDADRLKVGVTLTLPARPASVARPPLSVAPATPRPASPEVGAPDASASAPANPDNAPRVSAAVRDADLDARLEALSRRFADIRSRYASQYAEPVAQTVTAPQPAARPVATEEATLAAEAPVVEQQAPPAPLAAAPVEQRAAETAQPIAPAPARVDTTPTLATPSAATSGFPWVYVLFGVAAIAGLVLLVVLGKGMTRLRHGLRHRREIHERRSNDEALRAEIAKKAEKRLELEGEARRRFGRGDGAVVAETAEVAEPASGTIERAVAASEADPADKQIHEAELRIAHGFYDEAERLLLGVIDTAPNNHRAKLRLAEIYYLNERHDEFVATAEELHRLHRAEVDDESWQRIMRMGRIVAPERPPFSGPQAIEREA